MSTYLEDNNPRPLPRLNIEKLKWTKEKDLKNTSFQTKKMTKKFYFSFSASNNPACLLDPTLAATTWKFFIGQSSGLVWSGLVKKILNIARGTTDPEIDSMTWIKFSNNMALLAFNAYWPLDGATYISCKFGHQMAPLA